MKKNFLYEPIGVFCLRTPQLVLEDFYKLSNTLDQTSLVKEYFAKQEVKEAIYIASHSLYETLEKKPESALSSLLKYLLRMSTRATPFGLFSTVAIGKLASSTSLYLHGIDKIVKRARPDMEWLSLVTDAIEKDPEVIKTLKVISNPLSYVSGNRRYLEMRTTSKNLTKNTSSIRTSYLTDFIFSIAKEPILYSELYKNICLTFPNLDAEKIGYLLLSLFEQNYLMSELTSSLLTVDPFQDVLNRLPSQKELQNISISLSSYNQSQVGEGIDHLKKLNEEMNGIIETPHLLQVDAALHQEDLQLNETVAKEISESIELMWKLFSQMSPNYLELYHKRFLEKYGTDEIVPILQLINEQSGLGLKMGEQEVKQNTQTEWQDFFKNLFLEAILKREEIVILPEDLPHLQEINPSKAPLSCEVFCQIATESQKQLDLGEFTVILNGMSGQAGATIGRFTDILKETGKNTMRTIFAKEESLEPNVCFTESSYLPTSPRVANVAIHPNFREYEINLNFSKAPKTQVIHLDDIYVQADHERLILVSKRLNKEIKITFSNMLNPQLAPPILKFMRDISNQPYLQLRSFDFGTLADFPFLPRVRYKKTLLSLATWKLTLNAIHVKNPKDEKAIRSGFSKWQEMWRLPRYVFLTFLDHKILLDLKNPSHVDELLHELQNKKMVTLTEKFRIEESAWIKSPKGSHLSEFVIPFARNPIYKNESRVSIPLSFEKQDSRLKYKLPGSDWLYAKIYFAHDKQEEFIHQELAPFAESILSQNLAASWFYVRYVENDEHHVRLRFKGVPSVLLEKLMPKLHDWSFQLLQEERIKNMEICRYEREINRYGGDELIEEAEQFFYSDSLACAHLLRVYSKKNMGSLFMHLLH